MPDDLSAAEIEQLKQIASQLPAGHPALSKVNLLLNSQPTQFELRHPSAIEPTSPGGRSETVRSLQEKTGVVNTLKNMVPQGPQGSPFSSEFWLGKPEDWSFNPFGPGTFYNDVTRPLPKDLPTNVLSGSTPGGNDSTLGRNIYRAASVFSPLAGVSPSSMEEASSRGDTSGVATQAAVPAALAVAGPLVKAGIPKVRTAVSEAIHTPEGELTPKATTAAQTVGAVAGATPGIIKGSPYGAIAGGGVGYRAGPTMLERMFPYQSKPVFPGASLPSADEFYANEGAARMSLNAKQAVLDRAAARTAAQLAKVPDWEAPSHSEIPLGSPENPGPFNPIPSKLPASLRGDPFAPTVTEPTADPFTSKTIAPPSAGGPRFTGSEGRAATWTNETVQKLAAQGNREAIQQAIRRGMELPTGARYVMGDPDFSRAVYNPRSTTQFTPEGEPIRNADNPSTPAPRETIQVPQVGSPTQESINARTGEVTQPYNRRTSSAYDRQIFQQMLDNPENSEQMSQSVRQARAGSPNGGITEGEARNYLMKQPGGWQKFIAADEAGRRSMLIAARNALQGVAK